MRKFLAIFIIIFSASCKQEWSYEGKAGAEHWGELDEKYKFCKVGYNQSPIDVKYEFKKDEDLSFFYSNSDVEKERNNYVMRVTFDDRTFMMRGKKKYFLRHLSFRHPSEHLVNGQARALEMHITHKSDDEQLLKLAIFIEVGEENPQFNALIKFLNGKDAEGKIDLSKIVKTDDKTFFYDGSLTTPPCSEGVKWYVMKTPLKVSKEQMNQIIKSAIFAKTNARPIQAFHPEKF